MSARKIGWWLLIPGLILGVIQYFTDKNPAPFNSWGSPVYFWIIFGLIFIGALMVIFGGKKKPQYIMPTR